MQDADLRFFGSRTRKLRTKIMACGRLNVCVCTPMGHTVARARGIEDWSVRVGHQVNFFVMPADLAGLEAAIRATGDVCFLRDKSPTAQAVELDTLAPEPAIGPPCFTYFIVQRQELPAVSTRFIATQGYWLIEDTESPVIEFMPGVFTGSKLTRGRAYFASDLRFRPKLPSPGFTRWGDRVLTRIRKKLTRSPESATPPPWVYFGASALQWIQDSGATMTRDAASFTIHER